MKFVELCEYFEKIEATSKRLEKTTLLAELLHKTDPDEVRSVVNLALGQLAAPYERVQFALASKMLLRILAIVGKVELVVVEADYKKIGDLGLVAQQVRRDRKTDLSHTQLEIKEIYQDLVVIAKDSGTGSQERKVRGLVSLLTKVSAGEAKYIVRIVNESLRLGFNESTIIDVLSYFVSGDKTYSERLDYAYQMRPDIGLLATEIKTLGVEETLNMAKVTLGIPVIPALAQRLGSIDEMIAKMGSVYVEPKLDGTRVQIHFSTNPVAQGEQKDRELSSQQTMFGEEKVKVWVKTFTRNLDENTAQFPELEQIGQQLKAKEVVLDAEAIGYDPQTGALLPFQLTITRKRKHAVAEAQKKVPLRFFVFDILYIDGQSMIAQPLSVRRALLEETIRPGDILRLNEAIETDQAEVIREYHASQLAKGYEGVLVKKREGVYEPGRVNYNWVKLKEVENAAGKLADTLDVVVLGYYRGRGKRSDFGLGAFLIGVRDGERIVTIAKIGTGLSDEQFADLYARLKSIEETTPDPQYVVDKMLTPDVWVRPDVVVEVAADEITQSPSHSSGYGLRFPRLVKFRQDKSAKEITTRDEVMLLAQIGESHD